MQPPEPTGIAPGHNPDGLTVAQVGDGWRLVTSEEIDAAPDGRLWKCELWLRHGDRWARWAPCDDDHSYAATRFQTFRVKDPAPGGDLIREIDIQIARRRGEVGHTFNLTGELCDYCYGHSSDRAFDPNECHMRPLIRYTDSLDAIHRDLLPGLTERNLWGPFVEALCRITGVGFYMRPNLSADRIPQLLTATPEQLCRAFLEATK